jgi:hypothetical protein
VEEHLKFLPFYPIFKQKAKSTYDKSNAAGFDLAPGRPLNIGPVRAVDLELCLEKWNMAPVAVRNCLLALQKAYLRMLVFSEPEHIQPGDKHRDKVAQLLNRWTMQVVFDPFSSTQVILLLMSKTGGQGKSTLGYILAEILGLSMSTIRKAADVLRNRFSPNSGFIFLDEVSITTEADAEALKALITARVSTKEKKFKDAETTTAFVNVMATTNKSVVKMVNPNGNDRRMFALSLPSAEEFDTDPTLFNYICPQCFPDKLPIYDECGVQILCEHSFVNHASFVQLLYTLILNVDAKKVGTCFEEYVGMMYTLYQTQKAKHDWDHKPFSQCLIVTAATKALQGISESLAAKFMHDCVERGYTWCPGVYPTSQPTVLILREKDWVRLDNASVITWEKEVTIASLYYAFCEWCKSQHHTIQAQQWFVQDLEAYSRAVRQISLMDTKSTQMCGKMVYKTEYGQSRATWMNQGSAEFKAPCFDMGKQDDWIASDVGRKIANRDSFKRSMSAASMSLSVPLEEVEEYEGGQSSSSSSEEISSPPQYSSTKKARLYPLVPETTREVAVRGQTLSDIIRQVIRSDDAHEDARDEFQAALELGSSGSASHEASQDRRAREDDDLADERDLKKNKFLAEEASEVDQEEEEEEQEQEEY